jgi:arsenate reductase-like glutaredoxin family protein
VNIQIYGMNKCFDTKKAERYFKERRIKFQRIDLAKYGLSPREFDTVRRAVGLDAMINRDSKDYCQLGRKRGYNRQIFKP